MSRVLSDNLISIAYLLVWVGTLVWYQRKNPKWDGGSVIMLTYIVYAFVSILSINDPVEVKAYIYLPLKVFPYIFLYLMLMLALSPAIQFHLHPIKSIIDPNTRVIKILCWVIIITGLLQLPDIIFNSGGGFMKLIMDTDAGKDAYQEQLDNASDSGGKITNLASIIFNSLTDISVFLCFYLITLKRKNMWLICGLLFSMIVSILQPLMSGQRGPVMYAVLTALVGFMLFKQFISHRIVSSVKKAGVVLAILIMIPITAITLSRFSNRVEATIGTFMSWYFGQGNIYFNNYALDNNGIRYGDRTFNLVKRLVDSDTPKNYVERREKYHNLSCDDNLFVTFVGDFCIDFGPYIAVAIFLVFNYYVLRRTKPKNGKMKLHQVFLLYFTLCICMQGGMTLFSYSDTANIKMFMMIMFYVYLCYHERLEQRFPKTVTLCCKE